MLFRILWSLVRLLFHEKADIILENLIANKQIDIFLRSKKPVVLKKSEKIFLVGAYRYLSNWKQVIRIVKPSTVISWHKRLFRFYWKTKSRPGRPKTDPDVIRTIKMISKMNPLWGAPRIHGELLKIGIDLAQSTVEKYMVKARRVRSGSWGAFINNHWNGLHAMDFFIVPSATFKIIYGFVLIRLDRRKIVHVNATQYPCKEWVHQQLIDVFPEEIGKEHLIHDRDPCFMGAGVGIVNAIITGPRSPKQNAYAERVIGSIRRDCTDHVIIFNEEHLRKLLVDYKNYYNNSRTHLSLNKDAPVSRPVAKTGQLLVTKCLGGLHHRYDRTNPGRS